MKILHLEFRKHFCTIAHYLATRCVCDSGCGQKLCQCWQQKCDLLTIVWWAIWQPANKVLVSTVLKLLSGVAQCLCNVVMCNVVMLVAGKMGGQTVRPGTHQGWGQLNLLTSYSKYRILCLGSSPATNQREKEEPLNWRENKLHIIRRHTCATKSP